VVPGFGEKCVSNTARKRGPGRKRFGDEFEKSLSNQTVVERGAKRGGDDVYGIGSRKKTKILPAHIGKGTKSRGQEELIVESDEEKTCGELPRPVSMEKAQRHRRNAKNTQKLWKGGKGPHRYKSVIGGETLVNDLDQFSPGPVGVGGRKRRDFRSYKKRGNRKNVRPFSIGKKLLQKARS